MKKIDKVVPIKPKGISANELLADSMDKFDDVLIIGINHDSVAELADLELTASGGIMTSEANYYLDLIKLNLLTS